MTKPIRDAQVLILAGGLGTRLLSRVSFAPKSLAPIKEKVFLDFVISNLYRQGIRKIDLSLHHKADQFINWLTEAEKPDDLLIRYAVEPRPLGTAGAIAFCRQHFKYNEDLIVTNGDTYLQSGAVDLFNSKNASNWIGLVEVENTSRFGSVVVNDEGFITQFSEKNETQTPGTINAGMYFLKNELVQSFVIENSSLERDIFIRLVKEKQLKGIDLKGLFIDIGTPSDYDLFLELVENKKVIYTWSQI